MRTQLQGSLLVQALFRVGQRTLLDSLFALDCNTLVCIAKHSIASHILDAMLNSDNVAAKHKHRLMELLQVCKMVVEITGSL